MSAAHTPGPWFLDTYENLKVKTTIGADYVKFSGLCLSSGREAKANTRLIVAAPDLLEALTKLLAMCERQSDFNDDGDGEMFDVARSAITKATGATK